MIPTLAKEPPAGDGWLHEVKHDGYRTILVVANGPARGFTRNGNDWTDRYGRVCEAVAKLRCRSAVLDGEMIVQGRNGIPDFDALRADIERGGQRLVLFAFDLLHLDGKDLRSTPPIERRAMLRKLIRPGERSPLQNSDHFQGSGAKLLAGADRIGLEGIVSKRASSRYRSGRSTEWLKTKCFITSEFILVGITQEPKGPPVALLAREEHGRLHSAGGAFIGLSGEEREAFWACVTTLGTDRPAVELRRKNAIWLRPEMRVTVKHLKGSGGLRHASVCSGV